MTEEELKEEYRHIFETRLAIMCAMDIPCAAQVAIAIEEATEACEKLREE